MKMEQGLFASGLILGVGIGLMLGHFLRPSATSHSVPPKFAALAPFPSGSEMHFKEFSSQAQPARIESDLDLEEALDGLVPTTSPLHNALAIEMAREPSHETTAQQVPATAPDEPGTLLVEQAAPLSAKTARDQETIRGIISIELSHLSEEKQKVWFDALKDVNKEDVAGILRMWKLLGGPIPETPFAGGVPGGLGEGPSATPFLNSLTPFHTEAPVATTPSDPPAEPAEGEAILRKAAETLRHNTLYQMAPGYIPQVPVLSRTTDGKLELHIHEDFTSTRIVETGFPLNLAINGFGFFVVQAEDGTRYFTRRGNFTLDSQRRIALPDHGRLLVLQPEIIVTDVGPTQSFSINEAGEVSSARFAAGKVELADSRKELGTIQLVRVLQGNDLQNVGNGLYVLPKEKQEHLMALPGGSDGARIISGSLELPALKFDLENMLRKMRESMQTLDVVPTRM